MSNVGSIPSNIRTRSDPPSREQALARLAATQHGVVARAQLIEIGLSASAIRSRVASGRLHRLHRGVYAAGHAPPSVEARWLAAVLSCGPGAVLSHRGAGALLGIRPSSSARIDVTLAGRGMLTRPGISLHRPRTLDRRDVTNVEGIPCTTVPRTLLDLAEVLPRRSVECACGQAEMLRIFDLASLNDVLDRARGRHGVPVLRSILAGQAVEQTVTRSELEERFLQICANAGIPRPQVNPWVTLGDGGIEVDFAWPEAKLVVETDGYGAHGTRETFERDRQRDRRLTLAGWRVIRFTWRQVVEAP